MGFHSSGERGSVSSLLNQVRESQRKKMRKKKKKTHTVDALEKKRSQPAT